MRIMKEKTPTGRENKLQEIQKSLQASKNVQWYEWPRYGLVVCNNCGISVKEVEPKSKQNGTCK